MIKKLIALFAFIGLALCFVLLFIKNEINSPVAISTSQFITIKSGTTVNSFTQQLVKDKWIETRFWIKQYVRFHPELAEIKTGTYKVDQGTSLLDLLKKIVSGQEHQYSITFIEGSNFKEWLIKLNQHPQLIHEQPFKLDKKSITQLSKKLGLKEQNPEGLFFPETYSFTANTSAVDILKRANKKMTKQLSLLWENRDQGLPYKTAYKALIMASIVEKESGQTSEQGTIASVFVNRLNKRMRLQTDPTVIYGLGDRYKGDIKYRHLREKTAYNTYKIKGLPPTPIAMPGKSALKAVMQPETTSYLYFVSRGNGYHKFSKTLKEHNNAVRKYILKK